jgi:hypothetical protein
MVGAAETETAFAYLLIIIIIIYYCYSTKSRRDFMTEICLCVHTYLRRYHYLSYPLFSSGDLKPPSDPYLLFFLKGAATARPWNPNV